MKTFSISLLAALLLTLAACNNTEAADSAVPTATIDWLKFSPTAEQIARWQKEAESGNAGAQNQMGNAYRSGKGVPKDDAKAAEWFQKAALQGNANAQGQLGWMYAVGAGVPTNAVKAIEWLNKATAQGSANAQYLLGNMYFLGIGVPKDYAKAFEWFQKSALQGNAIAQYSLGSMYDGYGIPTDAAKAAEWYQKSALQGNVNAQYELGRMYAFGLGIPKDAAKGVKWFRKAAAQGNAYAQDYLATKTTRVTITWKSDPPGAVLYDGERRIGFTPFSLIYSYNPTKTSLSGTVTSATVRWQSGATAKDVVFITPRELGITPDCDPLKEHDCAAREHISSPIGKGHLLQSYTFKRPDNVPGRAVDEEFALKVEASNREQFGLQDTPSCRKEADAVEKERQEILLAKGRRSDAEFNKFENDEIAYASRCLPPAQAALIAQRIHDINVETQMKIDAINARQQPTVIVQPSRPSMEELIMQQPTRPPVSNEIHCTSRKDYTGQVITDCN